MGWYKLSKLKNKIHFILLAPFLVVLLMQFNNCSKYKQPELSTSSESTNNGSSSNGVAGLVKTGDLCEDTIRENFANGYYQFVRTNCTSCHANDNDKPQFASPDVNWAYQVFQSRGYTKVSNNAISSTHAPPNSGSQHIQQMNELKLAWTLSVQEYNTCKGVPNNPTTVVDPEDILNYQTANKNIPALDVDDDVVISWNLNTELTAIRAGVSATNFGASANFSMRVTRRQTPAGLDYYTFEEPVIYGNATDIRVKTIYIKLNSKIMNYPSTFKYVDRGIYANSTQTGTSIGLVSTGGLVVLGTTSSQDFLNVAFETIEATALPPPPPPVTVGFTDTSVRFITAADPVNREVDFNVRATGDVTIPVIVSVEEITDNVCNATGDNAFTVNNTTCLPPVFQAMQARGLTTAADLSFKKARSVVGTSYNRYDWDFKFTSSSFNLLGMNPQQVVKIRFSGDQRRENNRVLRLTIDVLSANATVTTQTLYVVILKASNPDALGNGEVTFSALMRSGTGILSLNCVKCHNSRDLNGGYDMTDFDLMLTKGVLVPSADPNITETSKMFNRMNPNYVGNETLSPMPLDGFLTDIYIDQVRSWIRSGAKNN